MTRRNPGDATVRQRPNGLWEARYIAADGKTHRIHGKTKRDVSDRVRPALEQSEHGTAPVDRRLTDVVVLR